MATAHSNRRNCLSGPSGSDYWRRAEFLRHDNQWTIEEASIPVPSDQTFARAIFKEAANQFRFNPSNIDFVVLYNEPFVFNADDTTGSEPVDDALIELSALDSVPTLVSSIVVRAALNAKVQLIRRSVINISTGWIFIHSVSKPNIIYPVTMPDINIMSNGEVTFGSR
jgi:hypothetical protein